MQPWFFTFFLCLLLGLATAATALERLDTEVTQDITILADPSLTVPITRIARRYSQLTDIPVSAAFGSSNDHLREIKEGHEGNVFITAKALWMKRLQQEGLMDVYSRTAIARNKLAIVAPLGRGTATQSLSDLTQLIIKGDYEPAFALGDPEFVAEGTYAFETLRYYKISGDYEPHFSILSNSFALKDTITNYDSYGAVFLTDAELFPDMVVVEAVDPAAHQPIIYQGAVIVGENMEQAKKFLDFLKSEDAVTIFRQYGFAPPY